MTIYDLISWLIVGLLVGSVAGMCTPKKKREGNKWKIFGIGLIGALIGGMLFDIFSIDLGGGFEQISVSAQDILAGLCGCLLFLLGRFIYGIIVKRKNRGAPPVA
jgi:uncharacterized membrane protein YeaQ/YmgE (transglycosylase-associated protein family)